MEINQTEKGVAISSECQSGQGLGGEARHGLASTADYLPFPSAMKYPKFFRAADWLSELIDENVFSYSAPPEEPQSGFYSSFHSGLMDREATHPALVGCPVPV